MIVKISSEKIEEFIEKQHSIDGMVSMHDFELWLEEQPRVGEWTPCSESFPEDAEDVLISAYGVCEIACLVGRHWLYGGRSLDREAVDAWMPLPPAYKESE